MASSSHAPTAQPQPRICLLPRSLILTGPKKMRRQWFALHPAKGPAAQIVPTLWNLSISCIIARYPSLVSMGAECGLNLTAHGVCVLPGLARPEGLATLLANVRSRPTAISDKYHTVTQEPVDPALPADHPRNLLVHARIGFVGRRALGADSPLVSLYEWPPLLDFVRAATNETLHLSGARTQYPRAINKQAR